MGMGSTVPADLQGGNTAGPPLPLAFVCRGRGALAEFGDTALLLTRG